MLAAFQMALAQEPPNMWTLKDSTGNPMVRVTFSRLADCKRPIPVMFPSCDAVFAVTNISGLSISNVWVAAEFHFATVDKSEPRGLKPSKEVLTPGETMESTAHYLQTYGDHYPIDSIRLKLDASFKSPQEEERDKKVAAEVAAARLKLQTACGVVYRSTIDKPVRDLTVRETQQIESCKILGWYTLP
jgi:hypothetical protein